MKSSVIDVPRKYTEEDLFAEFNLSGLALGERDVIEHMDSGSPKTMPVSYKKDGEFSLTI